MPTALQLPFSDRPAERLGQRVFRKQVLPVGSIAYKGRTLEFTPSYLERLAENFTAGAYDQVPFLLANETNDHHSDPERFRGEIKGFETASDGLYALMELTEAGAAVVDSNPRLGVSVRIVPDHPRGPAIEHVLGTLNPHVTGMRPWERVELSADTDRLIDLTGSVFVPAVADGLSPEELEQLRALMSKADAAAKADEAKTGDDTPAKPDEPKAGEPKAGDDDAELREAVEEFIKAINEDAEAEPAKPAETEDREPVAALSAEAQQQLDLARSDAETARRAADAATIELSRERYRRERDQLVAAGVPPVMIDLAKPLLEQPVDTIELSNGSKVDPAEIVRKVLHEAKGTIDFSERGSNTRETDDEAEEAKRLAKALGESY